MKNTLKRIMALMLSLVMMLGCIPSFINEASAVEKDYYELILSNINFNVEYGDMGLTFEEKVATYCGVEGGGYHFQIEYPIEGVDCLDAYLEPIYDDYPQETPQGFNFVSEDMGNTLFYRLRIGAYGSGKFDGTKTLKVKAPGCTIELPTVTRRDSEPSPSYYADGTGYYLDNDKLVACIDFRLTDKVTNLDLTYSSFYGKYDGLRFNESNNSLTATGFDLKTTDENIGLKDEDMLIIYSNSDGSGSSVYSFTDGVTYYVRTSLYISEGDIRTFSNEFNKYYLMINGNKVNLADLHPHLYANGGKEYANLVFYAPLKAKKLACFDFKGDFDLITHDTNIVDRNQLSVTFVDEKTNTKFNFTPYVKWYKTYNNPTDSYTDEVTTGKFEEDYYYVMGSIDLKSYIGFGDPQAIINDAKTNGFNILCSSIDIDSTYEDEHNYIRKYINPRIDIDTKNSTFTFRGQIDICPMPRVTDFEIESFDEDSLTIKLTGTNLFSYANHFGRFEMQFNSENFGCNLSNGGNLTVNETNTEATIVYPRDEFAPKFKSGDEMNIIIGGGASSQNRFEFAKSFTLGNVTPKIPITSVSLNGRGNLIGGVAISKQTLRYTEADGLKYKSNDDRGKTWYTTSACDVPADAIVAGTEYYKKITLDPVDGYKFDAITNVPVTNGTFVSATPNGKKLDVVIKATAEEFLQRDITIDVYKNNVKSNDPFITGSTNSNISFKDGVKTIYANWYENKVKNTGTITFDKTKLQAAIITINEEYKEPTSVKVGGTTLTKVTGESDFYTDELSSVYYYDSTNYKVVIKYLTMPKKSTLIINPTKDLYVGQDVQEVKITFDGLNPTACNYYKMLDDETPDPFSSEIEKDETYKLAGNITYGYNIADNFEKVYDGVKFGNIELEYSANPKPKSKTSLKDYNTSGKTLSIVYAFDGKDKPQPSHKKKKTEEPKQDEPKEDPKTPEEKMEEELKKDDVKKANSNEGEKINPSAKYINGYDDGSFKPNNKVNNIELMSMVTELFDNVEIKETKDLNQGKDYWGQEIIDKANALGLIPGNKDNKNYNLMGDVTRGDLAVVVYNLIKDNTDAPNLKDRNNCKDAIGKNYEKEAAKLLELGIFKGYDDGLFHGDYTLTRAEAVVVINRALKSLGFEINMPSIKLSFPDLSKDHWAYVEIMYAANK